MLLPPRPEAVVDPSELPRYDRLGWWGQLKLNGTCTVAETGPGADVYTRHLEPHKQWNPNDSKAMRIIRLLPPKTTLVGELMHSKVAGGHKDTLYLFDILTLNGEDLFGETLEDRFKLLLELLSPTDTGLPFWSEVDSNLWVTKNHSTNFKEIFTSLTDPAYEGWVLKNPKARLQSCMRSGSNTNWQVKCRRFHKNYSC